jgi:hypothetical protein
MNRKFRISPGSIVSTTAVATFLAVSLMAAMAHATLRRPGPASGTSAGASDPSTFNVGYFDVGEPVTENGTGAGDNIVHLINPTAANGNLCAMIYMYDDDQEIGECCGCPLSPNKLLSLSVESNLTSNWEVAGTDTDNGVVKIVSATPNVASPGVCLRTKGCNGGCDPTQQYAQTPALVGSILKTQKVTRGPAGAVIALTGLTETNMFQEGAPDATEATNLINGCAFIIKDGSGKGWCDCGPEDGPGEF